MIYRGVDIMELNEKIKETLIKINFIEKYEKLSNKFNLDRISHDERLVYIDGEEIMNIIKKMGYESLFDSREKFYKIKEEKIGKYLFGFHIIIEDGTIDFVWNVWEDEKIILGSPWGIYSRLLINPEYKIKRPVIGSYEDIEEILNVAFKMYEEFKNTLVSI